MTTYTGTLQAFITSSYKTLQTVAESSCPVDELSYGTKAMIGYKGWVHIGEAEITVTIQDEDKIRTGMVESIDKQIQDTYAEAESKINLLKQRKQELLAITMEAS